MAILGFELEEIARLVTLMQEQGLQDLIVEEEGRSLRMRGPKKKEKLYAARGSKLLAKPVSGQRALLPAPAAYQETGEKLLSPMVGVFYRSDKPGGTPLIQIGDHIQREQTIGVLEAMKVFSEFKSECSGIVVDILVKDGQLVHTGDVLMVVRKD